VNCRKCGTKLGEGNARRDKRRGPSAFVGACRACESVESAKRLRLNAARLRATLVEVLAMSSCVVTVDELSADARAVIAKVLS
jgi:hypothetical protein